jgi:hypothetical protein
VVSVDSDPVVSLSGFSPQQLMQLAGDPDTDPGLLHVLVEKIPPTRVAVASNPAADPALLQRLQDLGDPAVDAALAARDHNVPPVLPSGTPPLVSLVSGASTGPRQPSGDQAPPVGRKRGRVLLWVGSVVPVGVIWAGLP